MQFEHQLPVGLSNGGFVGAGLETEDVEGLLRSHAAIWPSRPLLFGACHVLAPCWMDAIQKGLDELGRGGIRISAVLPQMCQLDRPQLLDVAAREEALE